MRQQQPQEQPQSTARILAAAAAASLFASIIVGPSSAAGGLLRQRQRRRILWGGTILVTILLLRRTATSITQSYSSLLNSTTLSTTTSICISSSSSSSVVAALAPPAGGVTTRRLWWDTSSRQQRRRGTSQQKQPERRTSSSTTTPTAIKMMMSLGDFLCQQKQSPSRHIVIGNQAGDADSIVSAIGWAYTEHLVASGATPKHILTPIVSIPAQDLTTQRPETTLLLEWAGIHADVLHFVDTFFGMTAGNSKAEEEDPVSSTTTATTIPIQEDPNDEQPVWNVTLVDHNRLSAPLLLVNNSHPKLCVVEIIDHHLDEGYHQDTCRYRNIAFANGAATVASTCTLVVERWQQQQVADSTIPAPLSLLLLGVILLDSVNLQPSAGKVTPRDVNAVQFLLERTDWQELQRCSGSSMAALPWSILPDDQHTQLRPDTTAMFTRLQNAKFDPTFWKSLSVRDALRLDYKLFTTTSRNKNNNNNNNKTVSLGMSTVLLSLTDFWQNQDESVTDRIRVYMQEVQVDFLAILLSFSTTQADDRSITMQRQLILCGNEHFTAMTELVNFLQHSSHSTLELSEIQEMITTTDGLTVRFFNQGNAKASRKQVAPLLLRFFEEGASDEL